MKIDGACHCGFVTYAAEVDPAKAAICHCTDCQTLSGSAFRTVVPSRAGTFRLLSGTPTLYVKTAESGARRVQAFCPQCGSPIYSCADEPEPAVRSIRVGTVRQRDQLVPALQLWGRSSQGWLGNVARLPKLDTQPTSTPSANVAGDR
ncbi:MAG: GFA family protein [Alphaproteobacteria bacterium]